ncbi:MAG TPA: hypothetical protein VL523_07910 [Terriglobia bacterium]|nr:hypothetical protein [Terriglobia bacterium]
MKGQAAKLVAIVVAFAGLVPTAHAACGLTAMSKFGLALPTLQLAPPESGWAPAAGAPKEAGQTPSIVGLWNVTFYSGGQVFDQGFDQWHSDGTEILNDNAPPLPANGTGNMCLGVFKQTGPQAYKLRHPFWIVDANGNLAGSGFYVEKVTVGSGGNRYTGSFDFQEFDLNGVLIYEATGIIAAQRITVD